MKIFNALTVVLMASVLFVGCGKDLFDQPPVEPAKDKIADVKWCTADVIFDGFEIVYRYSFKRDFAYNGKTYYNATADMLRVSKTLPPQAYNIDQSDRVVMGKEPGDLYAVIELTNWAYKGDQGRIFERSFKSNPHLKIQSKEFEPKKMLTMRSKKFLTGEKSELNLFPCEAYSSTFLEDNEYRPMIEFKLQLSQAMRNERHKSSFESDEHIFEKVMKIDFPIEMNQRSLEGLEGTAWCSWYQMGGKYPITHLEVLTVGKGRVLTQTYINSPLDMKDNRSKEKKLQRFKEQAKQALAAGISSLEGGVLMASGSVEAFGEGHEFSSKYYVIQDSSSTEIILKGNAFITDNLYETITFKDHFYSCSDDRPHLVNDVFSEYLDGIVRDQLEMH